LASRYDARTKKYAANSVSDAVIDEKEMFNAAPEACRCASSRFLGSADHDIVEIVEMTP
jgi:hypothetical protein